MSKPNRGSPDKKNRTQRKESPTNTERIWRLPAERFISYQEQDRHILSGFSILPIPLFIVYEKPFFISAERYKAIDTTQKEKFVVNAYRSNHIQAWDFISEEHTITVLIHWYSIRCQGNSDIAIIHAKLPKSRFVRWNTNNWSFSKTWLYYHSLQIGKWLNFSQISFWKS